MIVDRLDSFLFLFSTQKSLVFKVTLVNRNRTLRKFAALVDAADFSVVVSFRLSLFLLV